MALEYLTHKFCPFPPRSANPTFVKNCEQYYGAMLRCSPLYIPRSARGDDDEHLKNAAWHHKFPFGAYVFWRFVLLLLLFLVCHVCSNFCPPYVKHLPFLARLDISSRAAPVLTTTDWMITSRWRQVAFQSNRFLLFALECLAFSSGNLVRAVRGAKSN